MADYSLAASMASNSLINQNSDLFFIWDATFSNPNGDMDADNQPRMDPLTGTNLVTDKRIKRYIRDYAQAYEGETLFVDRSSDAVKTATDRAIELVGVDSMDQMKTQQDFYRSCFDVRVFGQLLPLQSKKKRKVTNTANAEKEDKDGASLVFTGPLQMRYAESFHSVDLIDAGITSALSSQSGNKAGTIGRESRVAYSLLHTHGLINAARAQHTGMLKSDLGIVDRGFVRGMPLMATSSKSGQFPKLYVRIQYRDHLTHLADPLTLLTPHLLTDHPRKFSDIQFDLQPWVQYLATYRDRIDSVVVWQSHDWPQTQQLQQLLHEVGITTQTID